MNKKLKKFEQVLLSKKKELLKEIGIESKELFESQKELSGDVSSYTVHMADQSGDTFRKELKANLTEAQMRILKKIEKALKKIYEGNYGICEKCGKEIEKERLFLIPWTELCKKCQVKFEEVEE